MQSSSRISASITPPIPPDLVVMDDSLRNSLVKHLFVPLLQSLGLRYLLVRGVAMEDIVVSLTWGTCPNMPCCITNTTKRRNIQKKRLPILGRMPHFKLQGGVSTESNDFPQDNTKVCNPASDQNS